MGGRRSVFRGNWTGSAPGPGPVLAFCCTDWTEVTDPFQATPAGDPYTLNGDSDGSRIVVANDSNAGGLKYSDDWGLTWTACTLVSAPTATRTFSHVVHNGRSGGNSLWIAIEHDTAAPYLIHAFKSTDGVTFTYSADLAGVPSDTAWPLGLISNREDSASNCFLLYIDTLTAGEAKILRTTDGTTWTARDNPAEAAMGSPQTVNAFAYAGGSKWLGGTRSLGTTLAGVVSVDNGVTWAVIDQLVAGTVDAGDIPDLLHNWVYVGTSKGKVVALDESGYMFTSDAATLNTTDGWTGVHTNMFDDVAGNINYIYGVNFSRDATCGLSVVDINTEATYWFLDLPSTTWESRTLSAFAGTGIDGDAADYVGTGFISNYVAAYNNRVLALSSSGYRAATGVATVCP